MVKRFLVLPIFAISMSLSGCPYRCSDDDSWKEKYGNPELFFESVFNSNYIPHLYKYENENQTEDADYEVANYILKSGPFEEGSKKKNTVERYFTYEAYWQPATSGPNYCNMSIWDDGYIVINHKRSLGRLQSVYFSMDPSKAVEVVDFAFSKITENTEKEKSDILIKL